MPGCDGCELKDRRVRELDDDAERMLNLAQLAEGFGPRGMELSDRMHDLAREMNARAVVLRAERLRVAHEQS